jgi:glycosyltransferase involved in cell wall biosynthesis
MRILIISTKSLIPITNYGGTERVIWCLGKELVELGHKVTFLVKKKSHCNFANVIHYDDSKDIKSQITSNFDIIHSHSLDDLSNIDIPKVFTLHGNVKADFKKIENTICISKNHAERNDVKTYVYNGLDWDMYPSFALSNQRRYFHFLGKATWKVKNFKDATKIAVKTKNELHVLGGKKWSYENLKKGMFYKINPLIKYHGMVNNAQKMTVMNHSKGLIFPVKWHEPFGLAIIESMYAGAPAFGSALGALPELINEDVGVVSNNIDELMHAVSSKQFDPKTCRNYVLDKFNSKKMTINYLKKYEQVLDGVPLN